MMVKYNKLKKKFYIGYGLQYTIKCFIYEWDVFVVHNKMININ